MSKYELHNAYYIAQHSASDDSKRNFNELMSSHFKTLSVSDYPDNVSPNDLQTLSYDALQPVLAIARRKVGLLPKPTPLQPLVELERIELASARAFLLLVEQATAKHQPVVEKVSTNIPDDTTRPVPVPVPQLVQSSLF
jgi:hypothetical protein